MYSKFVKPVMKPRLSSSHSPRGSKSTKAEASFAFRHWWLQREPQIRTDCYCVNTVWIFWAVTCPNQDCTAISHQPLQATYGSGSSTPSCSRTWPQRLCATPSRPGILASCPPGTSMVGLSCSSTSRTGTTRRSPSMRYGPRAMALFRSSSSSTLYRLQTSPLNWSCRLWESRFQVWPGFGVWVYVYILKVLIQTSMSVTECLWMEAIF